MNGRGGAIEWTSILLAVLFAVALGGSLIAVMMIGMEDSAHGGDYHEEEKQS